MLSFSSAPPPVRQCVRAIWDCLSWILATLIVVATRYDFTLNAELWPRVILFIVVACAAQVLTGTMLMLYRGRYRIATFEESFALALSVLVVAVLISIGFLGLIQPGSFPRATVVLTPPVAVLLMAGGRWCFRAWRERLAPDPDVERVLIYGAGNAGYQLLRLIAQDRRAPYRVVGFVDDARSKRHLQLFGVRVVACGAGLVEAARRLEATTVILAISQADSALVRAVSGPVESAGLRLLLLPSTKELIDRRLDLSDVREVNIADVLGRHQVCTNLAEIADYVAGRVVMITGAGGSIGSELAAQVHRFGPKVLVLLDRDESALHAVQLSIYGTGLLDTPDMVLCDIRDEAALDRVFASHRPEVVFHTAALKHLPMLEQYPDEGWKTNVIGTGNVLRSAEKYGCTRFVNISTDKAAEPTSVLGQTKRLAERLTAWYGRWADGTYISVRFGNVLGSRGSVLQTFTKQIESGGPVTVTHPDVTRYFMTIPEACELVIQAGAIGTDGEVLVLDMGRPVRILDVARRLIAEAGREIDIVFTGLRHGEKLHEVLVGTAEHPVVRTHPMISHVEAAPLDPLDLEPLKLNPLSADGSDLPNPVKLTADGALG